MSKRAKARVRCLHVEGEGFEMRVQTVEGENLSPETMAAFLGIGRAAAKMLEGMPEQKRPAFRAVSAGLEPKKKGRAK